MTKRQKWTPFGLLCTLFVMTLFVGAIFSQYRQVAELLGIGCMANAILYAVIMTRHPKPLPLRSLVFGQSDVVVWKSKSRRYERSEAWIERWKTRRLHLRQVLRDQNLSHAEKIKALKQQKRVLQHWLRLWPFRFFVDPHIRREVTIVRQDIRIIENKTEQVKSSKRRREKWLAANPDHAHIRHESD